VLSGAVQGSRVIKTLVNWGARGTALQTVPAPTTNPRLGYHPKMPMKLPADLPDGVTVLVVRAGHSLSVALADGLGHAAAVRETAPSARIEFSFDESAGYWFPAYSEANPKGHGWGSFLYEVALEVVGETGDWLAPSPDEVSNDASTVWARYYEERSESVARKPIADRQGPPHLTHRYSKPDRQLVPALNELSRLTVL